MAPQEVVEGPVGELLGKAKASETFVGGAGKGLAI